MLSVNHLGFGACLGKKRDAKGKPLSVFLFSKLFEDYTKRYSKLISVGGPTGFESRITIYLPCAASDTVFHSVQLCKRAS